MSPRATIACWRLESALNRKHVVPFLGYLADVVAEACSFFAQAGANPTCSISKVRETRVADVFIQPK